MGAPNADTLNVCTNETFIYYWEHSNFHPYHRHIFSDEAQATIEKDENNEEIQAIAFQAFTGEFPYIRYVEWVAYVEGSRNSESDANRLDDNAVTAMVMSLLHLRSNALVCFACASMAGRMLQKTA